MRIMCVHALLSWKMESESTATIPKGITTGYNEMVTQMHSKTRWPSTAIYLISVIFFRAPLPVYTDLWIWYGYDTQYILRIFITQYFKLYYTQVFRFFKDNEINVIIPNFCPPVYYAWGYHNRTPCQMSCLLVFVHH